MSLSLRVAVLVCLPIPLLSLFDFVFTIMHPVFLMLFLPNCLESRSSYFSDLHQQLQPSLQWAMDLAAVRGASN